MSPAPGTDDKWKPKLKTRCRRCRQTYKAHQNRRNLCHWDCWLKHVYDFRSDAEYYGLSKVRL